MLIKYCEALPNKPLQPAATTTNLNLNWTNRAAHACQAAKGGLGSKRAQRMPTGPSIAQVVALMPRYCRRSHQRQKASSGPGSAARLSRTAAFLWREDGHEKCKRGEGFSAGVPRCSKFRSCSTWPHTRRWCCCTAGAGGLGPEFPWPAATLRPQQGGPRGAVARMLQAVTQSSQGGRLGGYLRQGVWEEKQTT